MVVVRTLWAFFLRDLRTARSYRLAWWLELSSGSFQVITFYFLSRIVTLPQADGSSAQPDSYFDFVVIGLGIYNFLITGIGIFATSLRSEQTTGTMEVLLSLPTPPTLTMFGVAMYGFTRSLLMTLIMVSVAITFFGLRIVLDPLALLVAFVALVASIALFASLGIVIGAVTIVFKQASAFVGIVTQGIGLLSGVFFPVALLPEPLRLLGEAIPVTWALNVLRETLLLGEIPVVRVVILVTTSVAAIPVAFLVFNLAVRRARQDGSLAQY